MKRIVLMFLLLLPCSVLAEQLVVIKYRDTPVDVDKSYFEPLNTSKSSWIRGAWYDKGNKYMVINLKDTNYHYCGMPESVWKMFKRADSFGQQYLASIKGRFDCRIFPVPEY